jgi:hypothetical protein
VEDVAGEDLLFGLAEIDGESIVILALFFAHGASCNGKGAKTKRDTMRRRLLRRLIVDLSKINLRSQDQFKTDQDGQADRPVQKPRV